MGRTEIAGFPLKSYETLQVVARKTATSQSKINGMGVVQSEPPTLHDTGLLGVAATGEKDSSDGLDLAKGTVR
jgi:hypothetical protein